MSRTSVDLLNYDPDELFSHTKIRKRRDRRRDCNPITNIRCQSLSVNELIELIKAEKVPHLVKAGRFRIIREFHHTTIYVSGKRGKPGHWAKTDNYIYGVGGRPSELAHHVSISPYGKFVSKKHLLDEYRKLPPKIILEIIPKLQRGLMELAMPDMIGCGELWYDPATGIWRIEQEAIDEYLWPPSQKLAVA